MSLRGNENEKQNWCDICGAKDVYEGDYCKRCLEKLYRVEVARKHLDLVLTTAINGLYSELKECLSPSVAKAACISSLYVVCCEVLGANRNVPFFVSVSDGLKSILGSWSSAWGQLENSEKIDIVVDFCRYLDSALNEGVKSIDVDLNWWFMTPPQGIVA